MAEKRRTGKRKKKSSTVTEYRRPININIGMVIFAVILLYVLYSVFRYFTSDRIVGYEVRSGSLSRNNVYTGIALRTEEVVKSDYAGHINFYTKEGERLADGKLAYTIDESGKIAQKLDEGSSNGNLFTDDDYASFQSDILGFSQQFDPHTFSSVYDFKDSLSGSIQKVTNNAILSDVKSSAESASVHYVNTDDTGDIVYYTDGYEDKTFDSLTASDFNEAAYKDQRKDIGNNSMISKGDPAYKLETSEDWSIAIMLPDDETAKALEKEGVVKVRFLKNQDESWADVTVRKDKDGQNYANLSFTNSMVTFCTDRFVSVELITDETKGLKIPKSALIDDEFFVIPADYVTQGSGDTLSVLREKTDESGNKTTELVTITPYGQDKKKKNYYVDNSILRSGDVLRKLDSNDTYAVKDTVKLTGVYNINKGYADFRQVTKIEENDEYAIVEPDDIYGLREYDYILLDAKTMKPGEFVYAQ